MRSILIIFMFLFTIKSINALGDIVYFDNGDRLSGNIAAMIDDKLTLENTYIGNVEIEISKIKTFETDEPVDIHYPDGKREKKVIEKSENGKVAVINEETDESTEVDIKDIFRLGPLEQDVVWSGNIRSGLNGSNGDSDTLNFNTGLNLQRRSVRNRTTFNGEYIFQQSDGETEENKWFADLKHDYFFSNDLYGFVFSRIEQDESSELDLRTILSSGLGYQWLERKDIKFATEAGLSWLYEDFKTGMDDNKITARLAYFYENDLWDKLRFFNNFEIYPRFSDPSDIFLTTTAGLRAKVTKKMFTEAKVIYEYDSTPATDTGKSNINYLFSLGMNF